MYFKKALFSLIAIAGSSALFIDQPAINSYKSFDRYSLFVDSDNESKDSRCKDTSSSKNYQGDHYKTD